MSPANGPTPNGWAAIGAVSVAIVAALCFWLLAPQPVAHTPVGRAPVNAVATLPPVDEPWYRTGLPVDGTIIPIGVHTTGHVTVVRSGERAIRVTITGFSTDIATADIRVQLTGGDVVGTGQRARWIPDGDPVEIGVIPHGATSAVIDVAIPQILPDEVHSLVVLDWNTTTILGGAELLPGR
ncbi:MULTISPECIES: hypothetical protein [unclassified Curtobacterium]|uniref:hypothetical protein n=1 Tax=unclassified Curtobacterium TaxID=257496 RepID=UPI0037FAAA4A